MIVFFKIRKMRLAIGLLWTTVAVPSICSAVVPIDLHSTSDIQDVVDVDQFDLKGTVGDRLFIMHLLRTGDRVNGYFRYVNATSLDAPNKSRSTRSTKPTAPLWLTGHFDTKTESMTLLETRDQTAPIAGISGNIIGEWNVLLKNKVLKGTRIQDGQSAKIAAMKDNSVPSLPYQMKVRMQTPHGFARLDSRNRDPECDLGQDDSEKVYSVDELYLYRNGQIAQTIKGFKAVGACAPPFPRIRDLKFNNQPTIVLATAQGISAQHYYLLWTYDLVRKSFTLNNTLGVLFTGWDDPIIDLRAKRFGVCWTSSGSWAFGSKSYEWKRDRLVEIGHDDCGDASGGQKCEHFGVGPNYRTMCQSDGNISEPLAW